MTIGITDVDTVALAARTKQWGRTHLDDVDTGGHEGIEAGPISHERNVINVASRRFVREKVDQGGGVDSERDKRRITSAPLFQPLGHETEVIAVPRHRALDIADAQHDVVNARDHRFNVSDSATAPATVRSMSELPTVGAINAMLVGEFSGMGSRCAAVGPDFALAHLIPDQDALRPGGFISGPTQFGMADAALWYLTFGAIGRIEPMALTSELSIRYVRPAQGTNMWARATLDKAGRRNVVGTVRIWCDDDEDRITATAQGTYALPA